jgi:hypothetical protein
MATHRSDLARGLAEIRRVVPDLGLMVVVQSTSGNFVFAWQQEASVDNVKRGADAIDAPAVYRQRTGGTLRYASGSACSVDRYNLSGPSSGPTGPDPPSGNRRSPAGLQSPWRQRSCALEPDRRCPSTHRDWSTKQGPFPPTTLGWRQKPEARSRRNKSSPRYGFSVSYPTPQVASRRGPWATSALRCSTGEQAVAVIARQAGYGCLPHRTPSSGRAY